MALRLFNTMGRTLEKFEPISSDKVGLYCCGPTVYDYSHIGNMRAYVFEDVLRRTLEANGYSVSHVMNVTDVGHLTDDADEGEDKMVKSSREKKLSVWEIAEHYTQAFFREASERLDDRGVLCFSVGATPTHYGGPVRRFLACLDRSMREAFADVLVIPGTTTMFIAAKRDGVLTRDPAALADRLTRRGIETHTVAPYEMQDRMADFRLADVRAAIDDAGDVRINTDLSPVCYNSQETRRRLGLCHQPASPGKMEEGCSDHSAPACRAIAQPSS